MSTEEFIKDIMPFLYGKPLVYIDAGAHHGSVFTEFAQSGLIIQEAHLFEPNRDSFDHLQTAALKLKAKNVRGMKCHNLALSDTSRSVCLRPAGTMTRIVPSSSDDDDLICAQCTTIDDVAQQFTTTDNIVLKVDVEGHEESVLKGAERLLAAQQIHLIYIEAGFDPENRQQCHYRVIEDLLARFNYRIFKIYEQKNEWLQDSPLLRRANIAFMSQAFAQRTPFKLSHDFYRLNQNYNHAAAELEQAQSSLQRLTEQTRHQEAALDKLVAANKAVELRAVDLERSRIRDAEEFRARIAALEQAQAAEAALRKETERRSDELKGQLAESSRLKEVSDRRLAEEARQRENAEQRSDELAAQLAELSRLKDTSDQQAVDLAVKVTELSQLKDAANAREQLRAAEVAESKARIGDLQRHASELKQQAGERAAAIAKAAKERKDLFEELEETRRVMEEHIALARDSADRVKRHLSYRWGAELVKGSSSVGGMVKLPAALWRAHKAFQAERGGQEATAPNAPKGSKQSDKTDRSSSQRNSRTSPALPLILPDQLSRAGLRAIEAEIGHLERALWGGYSQPSIESLRHIVTSRFSRPEAQVRAAWQLARWFSLKGDFRQVIDLLAKARGISKVFARLKPFRLIEINALLQLDDLDLAQVRITEALSVREADGDYLLMGANLSYHQSVKNGVPLKEANGSRLAALNTIFENAGLASLAADLEASDLTIDNLRCETSGRLITDGPKVSVLMAAFGAEEHIHLAVNSILKQTWRNLELIVVEDCSPDGTWAVMQRLAAIDKRVRIFRNTENKGAYLTRNVALSHATGEFITVHDSDDWSHPEMLAVQMKPLLEQKEIKATFSMMCRVTSDLRFGIRPSRRNLEVVHRSYPSLLLRRSDLDQVGVWDGVRANADAEMVARLRNRFGKDAVIDVMPQTPLSFFLVRPESLTEQGETSLLSLTFGVRHEYDRQAQYMAEKWAVKGIVPGERVSKKEPFAAPQLLLPQHLRPEPKYDLILVSDLSLLGGTRSCNLGYIDSAVASGRRVGLFHWPRGDLRLLPDINPAYRDRNQNPLVDIISCEEEVTCGLLILHHPPVMKHMLDRFPRITTRRGVILVNQLPYQVLGGRSIFYEPIIAERDFQRLFGVRPEWAPISRLVRRHLEELESDLQLSKFDWVPPVTMPLSDRRLRRNGNRVPVVGRHSRDHWTKWVEAPSALKAAYLVDTEFPVRLLGGAKVPTSLLGRTPDNWKVMEFDSAPVLEFIDSLDFLVHFPHTKYIEEFGRNVAESMARGVPTVLPQVFRETFDEAAIYCEPEEVGDTIRRIWSDPDRYETYARTGQEFVMRNCQVPSVQERFAEYLGSNRTPKPARLEHGLEQQSHRTMPAAT